ncbi:multidrug efflux RND transporter permease subunit [Pyxidicoccus parkwayensis]|uniref:Multidrug efflux RND transporter permease subunit n=1 Tax=Pyxidicoccus parkwayensis TaxID=2813578 RepID=A0ABX7NX91_9BACT|nr:multidrug efflux RND transporter permease subunit [Pyxidicoccus parkwaysis]QSQ23535.1 multidrug efflux RND transporter permease subunit [Pyxidicoccus parkwaysis]
MSISEPFIRRPVATTLLTVGLLIAGLTGYAQLPVAALPEVDYPTIVVSTLLPGASAETMASAVTTPLERQFGQIPALEQMTSVSSPGTSQITLQFTLERSIDAAEQDVQAAINATSNLLPTTLPAPPTYSKVNPADTPVLVLAVTSDTLPLDQVNDQADSILAQKLSQVSGVGLVAISGAQKPAVRVQVDPAALAGAGLTLEDVRTALVAANVNQPKGNLDGPRLDYALQTDDLLFDAASFRPIVLAYSNGAPIRLREVGDVIDGVENAQLAGWAGRQRAIILNVQRQPGANVIQVANGIKALLPKLEPTLAEGLKVTILSDQTETVRASVSDVQSTLVLTLVLVVAVNYVFLRSLRATLIPGIAVPLSLVGTFGLMYLAGYSLNNLSLMALTIATGFVVDDAIVMLENISRYIEAGDPPFEAALKGSRQIGFTIVSLTVSLVAVLIPLLFMGGLIGRLFREFAVTLAMAIFVSAVLSLTLTAMMCAHLLGPHEEAPRSRFLRASERLFDGMLSVYRRGLDWVLAHQPLTLAVTLVTLVLTAVLAFLIPKGFFPVQDTGLIQGITEAAPDVSFQQMMRLQQEVTEQVLRDADVASVASFIGADGTNPTPNSGRLSITLKPHAQRDASAMDIIARLKPSLAQVTGMQVFLQPAQDLTVASRQSRTPYQYTLEDADPAELAEWAPRMLETLRTLPQLTDVASDQQPGGLRLHLALDRDTAARVGVLPQALDDTLYDAFGQRQVSTIFTQLNQYRVILEVKPELQQSPNTLQQLYVRAQAGGAIPLSALVQPSIGPSPLVITHQDQFPSATLSFDTAPGVALGEAVNAVREAETKAGLPPGVRAGFQGTVQSFRDALASEPLLILAALVTVYIVLGVLYESYIHPITILSTLPSAGVGALLALMLLRIEFSIIALIGVVLLIGIVKKNAIMMIDFALEAERTQHLPPRDAIHQAALLRFRPIMMTTMAALLGGLPLALGRGTGSELRQPLGISIVGGLLVSQVLTLFTTPVVYLYMGRLGQRVTRRGRHAGAGP